MPEPFTQRAPQAPHPASPPSSRSQQSARDAPARPSRSPPQNDALRRPAVARIDHIPGPERAARKADRAWRRHDRPGHSAGGPTLRMLAPDFHADPLKLRASRAAIGPRDLIRHWGLRPLSELPCGVSRRRIEQIDAGSLAVLSAGSVDTWLKARVRGRHVRFRMFRRTVRG